MKNANAEKIQLAASEYLKSRSFEISAETKSDIPDSSSHQLEKLLPEEKVGLKEILCPSSPNSITFSTINSQYSFIDQQYIRLKSWMTEASEPCRSELSQVLFPLFIHLYLDLLTGAGKQAAKWFFSRHHQVFRVNRDYELTLKQVWSAAAESGSNSPIIQNLKSGKYLVRLSEVTLRYFLRYLQTSNNPTLLQIFNSYLEVDLSDSVSQPTQSIPSVEHEMVSSQSTEAASVASPNQDCTSDDIDHINEVIRNVRSAKPVMPTLALYNVHNSYNGLTCAKITKNSKFLVGGFEDSVLKLWKLYPTSSLETENKKTSPVKETESILFCDLLRGNTKQIPPVVKLKEDDDEIKGLGGRHVSGGEFCTLRGHRGSVYDVCFTHDSCYLLSVGDDAIMKLWDLDTHRPVAFYYGHHYPIWCLDVSQHSIYTVTGSYDETMRLWTLEYTHPLRTFVGHCGSVDCVAFHPNCSYVASGADDKSIRLWQVNDASVARVLLHHQDTIKTLKFSPDGKYLASGSANGEALIWDLNAGKVLHQINPHTSSNEDTSDTFSDSIVSLDWSRDSRVLYSSSANRIVKGTFLKNLEENITCEIGNLTCESDGLSSSLVHMSLSKFNYIQAVVNVHGER